MLQLLPKLWQEGGGLMTATAVYVDLLQSAAILLLALAVIVTAASNRRR